LTRLAPDRIVVIGASGVVSDGVVQALGAFAPTVERLAGSSRYSTAANIAATIPPNGRIFVVTADKFPDGLASVPLANGTPIAYSAKDQIHQVTADAIALHTGTDCKPLTPPPPPPPGDGGRNCPAGWIALTYDDGPRPGRTDTVVAALERAGIRGTFFPVGYLVAAYPSTLKNAYNHGHAIANHTWNHENLRNTSYSQIVSTISRTDSKIRSIGIPATRLVRPPYGATDSRVKRAINEAGFGQALWNIDPRDWAGTSVSGIYNNVVGNARNGSVVVMHDGSAYYRNTAAATERIVSTLHGRGFCFGVLNSSGRIVP
jgi:peptidoglycan/xylan/chitin deacetylase (PgdA/CDA1 family)